MANIIKPRVLFTSPILAYPPKSGPELRICNSIKALAEISDLSIFSTVPIDRLGGEAALSFFRTLATEFEVAPRLRSQPQQNTLMTRLLRAVSRRLLIDHNVKEISTDEADGKALLTFAKHIKPDVIWLGYGNISYPLLKYIKDHSSHKVVVDTDSVWSRFVLRGLEYASDETQREEILRESGAKEQEEQWGTQLADVTTAVSEIDAEYYSGLAKNQDQVRVFSNVIDPADYTTIASTANENEMSAPITPSLCLTGSFYSDGCPMVDAARWMIEEIMPRIRTEIPKVHLYLIGRGSEKYFSGLENSGITGTGMVPSVLPYLDNAQVAIVPLRFESGTRFKILEAGVCGKAVVSTTLGAEGIDITDGHDILIADDPETFANAVIHLLEDRVYADTLGANLRKLVTTQYSVATLAEQGKTILDYLLQT